MRLPNSSLAMLRAAGVCSLSDFQMGGALFARQSVSEHLVMMIPGFWIYNFSAYDLAITDAHYSVTKVLIGDIMSHHDHSEAFFHIEISQDFHNNICIFRI